MTRILLAGDGFVPSSLLAECLTGASPHRPLDLRQLTLPWPTTPFGDVESVHEASGSTAGIIDALIDATVLITQMAPVTEGVLQQCPELKLISVCRGGPVNVDLNAATRRGVVVTFAPARNGQAAAEHAVALTLSAARQIPLTDSETRAGVWRGDLYAWENVGTEIASSTVGLVGFGAIARIVARIFRGFGARVVAYDPYAPHEAFREADVSRVSLEELMKTSDIVSLHARSTPDTQHLINADLLRSMRPGSILVNTARGGLLDHGPLPEMLRSGHLRAVALDVYDPEPPGRDWDLLSTANTVLTPHLAGATRQTAIRAAQIVAADVTRWLDGENPLYVANPEVLREKGVASP